MTKKRDHRSVHLPEALGQYVEFVIYTDIVDRSRRTAKLADNAITAAEIQGDSGMVDDDVTKARVDVLRMAAQQSKKNFLHSKKMLNKMAPAVRQQQAFWHSQPLCLN